MISIFAAWSESSFNSASASQLRNTLGNLNKGKADARLQFGLSLSAEEYIRWSGFR